MRRFSLLAASAALATLALPIAMAQEGPNLGAAVTADDAAAWDISIGPDGTGLPSGSGTARAGKLMYEQKCLVCHGADGAGQPNDRLAGGHGTLEDANPVRTVGSYWPYATTLFDYIRRAMPYLQPQSLTNDETYALTAYVLALNDVIDEDDVIDARTLPRVEMPNRDNFVVAYPGAD
jgi:mono/diheme cytochrome c family protein